ncbi:MAG: hypothetical protein KAS62_10880, partial [Candidatus Delongbacteria bacterium]|nr:hypothetical protein [Candidatus Delongbacteria bacterium]
MKDKYLEKMEEWNKDFFKNYLKMEKKILAQLKKYGQEYFILNDCYQILGRFEPTLETYCEICEKLGKNEGNLLQHYLHLNDIPNVKKQQKFIKGSEHYFIYKDFHKYQDSGEVLESKYVSIKYDKRIEKLANMVFEQTGLIDKFITKEWKGMLPPKVRVIFMNHNGPGPYNGDLNETYLPVKGMNKSDVVNMAGDIVHETFHLANCEIIKKTKFGYDWGMNSFKLLDEGYAQLIQYKFIGENANTKKKTDYYSQQTAIKRAFNFYDMKDKWTKLFSENKTNIYALALSFAYFLEDKFGHDKFKNIFFPLQDVKEDSWLEYTENYFGHKIDDLIKEWKQGVIDN